MKSKIVILAIFGSICLQANSDINASDSNLTTQSTTSSSSVVDMSAYDRQFDAIGKIRVGLSDKDIVSLKDPFSIESIKKYAIEEEVEPGLIGKNLNAIIANKVKINDTWYSLGEYIGSYKIMQIKDKSVIIENEKQNLELKLNQGNQNVIITIN